MNSRHGGVCFPAKKRPSNDVDYQPNLGKSNVLVRIDTPICLVITWLEVWIVGLMSFGLSNVLHVGMHTAHLGVICNNQLNMILALQIICFLGE